MSATAGPSVEFGAMWTTTLPAWKPTPALMGSLIGAVDVKCLIENDWASKIVLLGFKKEKQSQFLRWTCEACNHSARLGHLGPLGVTFIGLSGFHNSLTHEHQLIVCFTAFTF